MGSTIELNVQTVTAGQMGPIVRLKAFRGWTIGHAKAALEERGCGPAAQIKLIQQGSTPANDTLLTDLDNPAGIIAATPMAPTKDSSTPVDDSVIELNLQALSGTTATAGIATPVTVQQAQTESPGAGREVHAHPRLLASTRGAGTSAHERTRVHERARAHE